ncbi:MAG: hypothetical protein CL946_12905 [Ectothiorhodospiraceae bacterium]|nr:hypothetical protein [Ectothiorhodospiraceae bacterium]
MRVPIIAILICLAGSIPALSQEDGQNQRLKLDPESYREGYDIPLGVPHGTWDFDEWPGVDHPVKYKEKFQYNLRDGEKLKIDYQLSAFDEDDHEGYLKTPDELLARGFGDFHDILVNTPQDERTLLGFFTHPDDEILIAGGLLAYAKLLGWDVKAYLITNGADGSQQTADEIVPDIGGYNLYGVMPGGGVRIASDTEWKKREIIQAYAQKLGLPIQPIELFLDVDGKRIAQLGEYPGLDWKLTFGPGTVAREAIAASCVRIIDRENPSIVLTHGTEGEYGHYLHRATNKIMEDVARRTKHTFDLYTGFPEYNYSDRITHFIDLNRSGMEARERKFQAFRGIEFIHSPGLDYDKPWNPEDDLMDGAFVKDYGLLPTNGYPPRYEFYQRVEISREE